MDNVALIKVHSDKVMESPVFNYYRRKIWKIDNCHRLALWLPPCIDAINKTAFYSKATRGPQLWLEQWLQKHGRPNSSPKMEPKCLYRPLLSGRSTGHKPRLLNASGWELGGKNMSCQLQVICQVCGFTVRHIITRLPNRTSNPRTDVFGFYFRSKRDYICIKSRRLELFWSAKRYVTTVRTFGCIHWVHEHLRKNCDQVWWFRFSFTSYVFVYNLSVKELAGKCSICKKASW